MGAVGRVVMAGVGAGLVGVLTSWLITGVLFHRFQGRTPATWRPGPESGLQYAAASCLTIAAALLLSASYHLTSVHATGAHGLRDGLAFGVLCWAALAVPVLGSIGVFVNLHRGVIIGLAIDWLVVCLLAGGAAGLIA